MSKSSLVLSFKKELLLFLVAFTPAHADLTLHRVMLSAAGVGYFELNDTMPTAGTLGLDVPLDQVDDVQLAADEVRLNDLRNSVAAAGTRVADAEAALAAEVGKLAF